MVETLQTISIVCFVLAGISFIVAVILFIVFRIPSVIGSLTGRTARREIEEIQQQSADTGNIGMRMGREIKSRGGHTGQFTQTGSFKTNSQKLREEQAAPQQGDTGNAAAQGAYASDGSQSTDMLNYGAEGTSVLNYGADGTTVLNYGAEGTTVLGQQPAAQGYGQDSQQHMPANSTAYAQPGGGPGETMVLNPSYAQGGGSGETMVLNPSYGQAQPAGNAGDTMVLGSGFGQAEGGPGDTMVLNSAYAHDMLAGMQSQQPVQQHEILQFTIDYEIGYTSSRELIEIA